MNVRALARVLVLAWTAFVAAPGAARAADVSETVFLVASERLAGSGYEQTVLLAAPLPRGGHVGFIVNRPTGMTLAKIFPEHAPSRAVVEPLYFGGPVLPAGIFAVTRRAPKEAGEVIPLMPGLVAVLDGKTVDQVIETSPNEARYYAGLMLWEPGELEDEVREGAWQVRQASVDAVLGPDSAALWKSLTGEEI